MSNKLAALKASLKESGLESQFLKAAGLSSLDDLSPENFRDVDSESPIPKLKSAAIPDASPLPAPKADKSAADASPGPQTPAASDLLFPFLQTSVIRKNRKSASSYMPNSMFMYFILHHINELLVDNFYFKRACPDYHPYILRLYFGILFIIQVLRAHASVMSPGDEEHDFLIRFLDTHRLETLSIPGPLLSLFKTISSSQPEFGVYGKVYPKLPSPLGPQRYRDLSSYTNGIAGIPAVPGIFALLTSLNAALSAGTPVPKGWIPVQDSTTNDVTFQGHTFVHHTAAAAGPPATPKVNNWSDDEAWYLMFPGLEFGCEATQSLNTSFTERYDEYLFPTIASTSDISSVSKFLGQPHIGDWFNKVKDVAASASAYFEGSGTLADCSPSGVMSNQVIAVAADTSAALTKPWRMADPMSRFAFSFRLSTTSRTIPQMFEVMSAAAQTNSKNPSNHPYAQFTVVGSAQTRTGDFWSIRPIDRSALDESSYQSIRPSVKKAMKSKV